MTLEQYVQQYTIDNNDTVWGKIIEINHYGQIIHEYYYDTIDDHIQIITNPKNDKVSNYWYFLRGPHDLYITLLLQNNTFFNFSYKLYILEHLTSPIKRGDMWISEYDYHLCDIYEYNKKDLYVHNRLFSFFLNPEKEKNIYYKHCYENFMLLTQQLNCALQLYINQNEINIQYNNTLLEQSIITKGINLIGKLINIDTNQSINIYDIDRINCWKNIDLFEGYYQKIGNFYIIYIDSTYYICNCIDNSINIICRFTNSSSLQYIYLRWNFAILSHKINTNDYNYLCNNFDDTYYNFIQLLNNIGDKIDN